MIAKDITIRKIGHGLKHKTKQYSIQNKTCDGGQWPLGNHYYCVTDHVNMEIHHVGVWLRPTWEKYYCPEC